MFARILEFTPRFEKKNELIKTVKAEVLPILTKQPGFLEMIPLVPEGNEEKAFAITLWTEKGAAEKYVKEVFPKVEQIVKPYIVSPIAFHYATVESSLCRHLVDALTAVA